MPNGRPRQRNTRHANRQRNLNSVRAEPVVDEAPPVVMAEAVETDETDLLLQEIRGMEEALDAIAREVGVPEGSQNFGHFQLTIDEIREKDKQYRRSVTNWKSMNDHKTEQINKLDDEKRTSQRVAKQFMDKYEKAKAGTLLAFQEIELEDKDKEINEKDYMIEKLMDKCEEQKAELRRAEDAARQLIEHTDKAMFLWRLVSTCDPEVGAHVHLGQGRVIKVLDKKESAEVKRAAETDPGAKRYKINFADDQE